MQRWARAPTVAIEGEPFETAGFNSRAELAISNATGSGGGAKRPDDGATLLAGKRVVRPTRSLAGLPSAHVVSVGVTIADGDDPRLCHLRARRLQRLLGRSVWAASACRGRGRVESGQFR